MTPSPKEIFKHHFNAQALKAIAEHHLSKGTARGVDGVSVDLFLSKRDDELCTIFRKVFLGTYKFSPFREKLLVKGSNQLPRQVSIPTIRDRVTLRALNNFLADIFPAARPRHSHHTVSAAIQSIRAAGPQHSFIKLDIKTFYDDIDHALLLKNLRAKIRFTPALQLIASALSTPTGVSVAAGQSRAKGIPQGLSIANILASIYLLKIDEKYTDFAGVHYHRYVDDILCIAPTKNAEKLFSEVRADFKKKNLTLHDLGSGKSTILPNSERLDYLGYSFLKDTVSVREKSVRKLLNSLMRIIHTSDDESLARSLWRINLRISGCQYKNSKLGWMFYFSQVNDLALLARIDFQIRKAMTQKFGLQNAEKCKRLIKSYYEIKYNLNSTSYIPNFDKTTNDEKRSILKLVGLKTDFHSQNWEEIFDHLISREVRDMERDTIEALS